MINEARKKQLSGLVLSSKMDKTIVIKVARKVAHPVYKKLVYKTKKYYAHDPKNLCEVGDLVKIIEVKPISKLKRWSVLKVEKKAIN